MDDDPVSCIEPKEFSHLVGQPNLFEKDKPLYKFYHSNAIVPSLVLYGPPGCGKTSYAKLLAKKHNRHFAYLNAAVAASKDLREALSANNVLIVIDEIHRFDKRQQDILLPYLENGTAAMIGTSTYNPYFKLTKALRSRCFVYEFKPLKNSDLHDISKRILGCLSKDIKKEALDLMISYAQGDARKLVNMIMLLKDSNVDEKTVRNFFTIDSGYSSDTERYDIVSAFIKSIRGSDADAALYWLARMIKANEDPKFIARRLCILASEDVGLADNNAINVASNALNITKEIGLPECAITLAHCTVYLAYAKKSNSSYTAIKKAINDVENGVILDVPDHLKSKPKATYLYPHNYKNSYIKQAYLTRQLKYFVKKENDLI
jgi:putative ATPase